MTENETIDPTEEMKEDLKKGEEGLKGYNKEGDTPIEDVVIAGNNPHEGETPELETNDKEEVSGNEPQEGENPEPETNDNESSEENSGEEQGEQSPTPTPAPTTSTPIQPGVSSAYGIPVASTRLYEGVKPEKPTKSTEGSKAPQRSKPNDPKGNTLMEMCFNEVMGWFDSVADWATDKALDFTDFVFNTDDGPAPEKKRKTSVFAIGQRMRDTNLEDDIKKAEAGSRAYEEFLRNLENDKNNRPVKWEVLQDEPTCFREVSEIYKKEPILRSDDENALIHTIKTASFKDIIEQERHMRSFAIDVATCDVAAQKQRGDVFGEGSGIIMEALEKSIKDKKYDIALQFVDALSNNISQEGELFFSAKLNLTQLKDSLSRGDDILVPTTLFNRLKENQNELCENPEIWGSRVADKTKTYYNQLKTRALGIRHQDKHTVSAEFTEQLLHLDTMFGTECALSPNDKKTKANELIVQMEQGLDEQKPEQKAMKEQLKELKTTLDGVDPSVTNANEVINTIARGYLETIKKTHDENDPKKAELQEFFVNVEKSCLETKEAIDSCASILGIVNKKDKAQQMDSAVKNMQDIVKGESTSPQPKREKTTETIILDVINSKTR